MRSRSWCYSIRVHQTNYSVQQENGQSEAVTQASRGVISKKFASAQRENHHPQQHQSVSPSRNVGLAAGSFGIAQGNVDQFEIQLCGTESRSKSPNGCRSIPGTQLSQRLSEWFCRWFPE
jgi:hypothetical protein